MGPIHTEAGGAGVPEEPPVPTGQGSVLAGVQGATWSARGLTPYNAGFVFLEGSLQKHT